MKYLDYYDGCMVHHKDGNRQNNNLSNLQVVDYNQHYLYHINDYNYLGNKNKGKITWNKGKKMDEEFSNKCKIGIIKSKVRKLIKEKNNI